MSNFFFVDSYGNATVDGYISVDGYTINPNNATTGQVLQYDGYNYVAATIQESDVSNLVSDLSNRVLTSTSINTTAPLSGGGDLSTTRTLGISQASNSTDGYLSRADWNVFNNKGTVSSVATNSTLTGGTITTSGTLGINLSNTNTWTAKQTFNNHITIDGYTIDLSAGATANQLLQYNGTSFVAATVTQFNFGDGYDGALHITSGTVTLTRDMYYTTVLIDVGATLDPQGCKVFASTSITNNGTISRNGANGTTGSGSGSTLTFTSLPLATLPMCSQAPGNIAGSSPIGAGGGTSGSPAASNTYTLSVPILSNQSFTPAHGGQGGSNGLGNGGTSTVSGTVSWVRWQQHSIVPSTYACSISGAGGGGGIGLSTGGGGSGGEGGGCIGLYSPIIINNGSINAKGGNGGNGGSTAGSGGSACGGGGGGGGMGGFIQTISLSAPTGTGTWNVAGGAGGNGGSADTFHGGVAGNAGVAGSGGTIQMHSLSTGTITVYTPTH